MVREFFKKLTLGTKYVFKFLQRFAFGFWHINKEKHPAAKCDSSVKPERSITGDPLQCKVNERKVMEIIRLKVQFVAVANAFPVLRAHNGYMSELMVQGIGPMPGANAAM